ncbi:MAG: DNA replication/repair protein RecF [Bacilli bacterium]|nr:DNA replication/repair protein RecF [Bacilli bacterium]
MIIKNLKLKNFRNYNKLDIKLSNRLNIFIGDNAQGKSNILESIVVLALTKSYLNVKDKDLIKDGEMVANIVADVDFGDTVDKLFISFSENEKKIKINNNDIKKYSDYVSRVRFILFSPMDIGLIKDSPAARRKNFNVEISQLSNKYVKMLQNYNALLKKRNQFLKTIVNTGKCNDFYLDILDDKFSTLAVEITKERDKFVSSINEKLGDIYDEITGNEGLILNYLSVVDIVDDKIEMKNLFLKKLKNNFEKDKFYGMTLLGPHRDDYSLFLSDKDLAIYGSQGQNRAAILALKLAEIDIFKNICGDYPILLLDDIFSELDTKRKNRLVKYILDDVQTIITTTDLNVIDDSLVKRAKIFNIRDGKVVINRRKKVKDE